MKALYYRGGSRGGGVEWRDDPWPTITRPTDALVRPIAVSTCDLDQALLRGSIPGPLPAFPLGHEGIGEVVEVGSTVGRVRPGETVVIPYHLSCGACDRCGDGLPLHCRATAAESLAVYGIPVGADHGGLFSELVRVPYADHALVPLPPSVGALDAVSVGDNLTDAYRAVAPRLRERPGADVLILSGGSTGLYAADVARALGAGTVSYVDASERRRALAADLGAQPVVPEEFDPAARQHPISLVTRADPAWLRQAVLATAPGGHVENVGIHFSEVELPLLAMHLKCLTFRSALSNARPLFPEVLALLASGRLRPRSVQTDVVAFDAAAEALAGTGFKPVFLRDGRDE